MLITYAPAGHFTGPLPHLILARDRIVLSHPRTSPVTIQCRLVCLRSGLQSKRPQVKTSPSQNVPELVRTSPKIGQNVPMVKIVGQNVPKMIFIIFFKYF